jgi:hypothetical protein
MDNYNGVSTPIEPNLQLIALDDNATSTKKLDYQRAIGSIMYAMLGTRLDLAFTVSTLSKYCINLGPQHAQAVQCVFRYLKKTLDYGITFSGTLNLAVDEAIR